MEEKMAEKEEPKPQRIEVLELSPIITLNLIDSSKLINAIVITCSCCPDVKRNDVLLDVLNLPYMGFEHIPLDGISNTLTGQKKRAMPEIAKNMKSIINKNDVKRILILMHQDCSNDFLTTRPKESKTLKDFRVSELSVAESAMRSWVPLIEDNSIEFELYFVEPYKKGLRFNKLNRKYETIPVQANFEDKEASAKA